MDKKKFKEVLSHIINNNSVDHLDLLDLIMYAINILGKQFDEQKLKMLIHNSAYSNFVIKIVIDYIYMHNDKFGIQPIRIQNKNGVFLQTIIEDLDEN